MGGHDHEVQDKGTAKRLAAAGNPFTSHLDCRALIRRVDTALWIQVLPSQAVQCPAASIASQARGMMENEVSRRSVTCWPCSQSRSDHQASEVRAPLIEAGMSITLIPDFLVIRLILCIHCQHRMHQADNARHANILKSIIDGPVGVPNNATRVAASRNTRGPIQTRGTPDHKQTLVTGFLFSSHPIMPLGSTWTILAAGLDETTTPAHQHQGVPSHRITS